MNKSKILLMNPNFINISSKSIQHIPGITIPLIQTSAILNYNNYEVDAVDFSRDNTKSFKDNIQYIIDNKFNIVCIFAVINTIKSSITYAKHIKELSPNIKIIVFHQLSKEITEEILNTNFIDIVAVGEEDYILLDIISGKDLKDIDGIIYKDKLGKIIYNNNKISINSLDDLPSIYYGYKIINSNIYKNGFYLTTSRGCKNNCNFCSIYHNKTSKIAYKSPNLVAQEIAELIDNYGNLYNIDQYNNCFQAKFFDTLFTSDKEYTYSLMDAFDKYKINIKWYCQTRVDMVDEELLQSMYNHGCYGIIYGAESVDQNILNFMNKGITVDQIENAINISRKANIKVMLNFIFGMPGETISNIKNTIEFAKNIKPESIGFQIATPIPGTKLYDYCVENDLLLTKDWDLYNLTNQIIKLDNIKNGQIEHYRSLALSLLMNNNYTNNDENEYLFHIL